MLNWKNSILALSLTALAAAPLSATAAQTAATKAAKAQANAATAASKATKAQTKVVKEAITALTETGNAIKALQKGNKKDAVAALEHALGQLDVVLAQHPDSTLIPVDVSASVIDIFASPDEIRRSLREARGLLEDGHLQQARPIIANLASEVDITTTYLPLGTYPLALKSAAALIKDNKTDEALQVLGTALDTLVADQIALPLPMLDGAALIADAQKLVAKKDRTKADDSKLADLLTALDLEIDKGEALQYGSRSDFTPFREEMRKIRGEIANGGAGTGYFDKLKGLFEGLGHHAPKPAKPHAPKASTK